MSPLVDLVLNFLISVRSVREWNFSLYVSSVKQVMKWYYDCDNYHYAHRVTVHFYDLVNLPSTSTYLYNCFSNCYFTFLKSNRKFSLEGINQVHEQNNLVKKGKGGAILVLNKGDESRLARWEPCFHELCLVINVYEGTPDVELDFEPLKHHQPRRQRNFSKFVLSSCFSVKNINSNSNKLAVLNNEKATFNDMLYESISKMPKLGELQSFRWKCLWHAKYQ